MNLQLSETLEAKTTEPLWLPTSAENRSNGGGSNHADAWRLPVRFECFGPEELTTESDLSLRTRQAYGFEGLLVDILARFVNLPAEEVEREIQDALSRVCEFLDLDRAGLWRQCRDDTDSLILTHECVRLSRLEKAPAPEEGSSEETREPAANRALPPGAEFKACYPWMTEQIKRGKSVVTSQVNDLPAEARLDTETMARLGTRSSVVIPFLIEGEVLGALSYEMVGGERLWPQPLVKRLEFVAEVFAQATSRMRADKALAKSYAEIKQLKDRLQTESDYLKAEIKVNHAHGEIIGRSRGIRHVLHQVEQVAPADCSVLINGETGTGKELIAQAIHRLSPRGDRVMVLVNCAALPGALVESELFGRERGAYTGALTSQVGRFEVANGSTIFLDEVGELSMEVQAKLLRVLQQGEFQRLGSPKSHKVDVRVIAATNRDLAEDVRKGRFREDLFYRLHVFPIEIPPLRERTEDIPLLVFAFMEEFATRMGKKITKIQRKGMELLQAHSWPGNIRELRNVIEHSMILTAGDTLKLTALSEPASREVEPVTLAEAEREHILKTLESTGWRIKGPRGAAARLGLQPSTLYSRMQKLGIPHRRQKDEMSTLS